MEDEERRESHERQDAGTPHSDTQLDWEDDDE